VFLLAGRGKLKLSETIIPAKYSYKHFDWRFLFDLQGLVVFQIQRQLQWNPDFSNLQGKEKFGSKNRKVREIGSKITVFDWGEGTTFGSSYREVRKNEGSRSRDSLYSNRKHILLAIITLQE